MRRLLLLVIISLMLLPVSAKPEFWLGASFYADYNEIPKNLKDKFPAMSEAADKEGMPGINEVRSIGLSVDFAFFPWEEVRIGIVGASHTMIPIGFTPAGGESQGYISYDFDLREDLSIGLGYYQFFTPTIGMFLSGSFQYSWYRSALHHVANQSAPMDYIYFHDYGVLGEAGIITRSRGMFFRFGFSFFYDLMNSPAGFRIGLMAGGGFIFGGSR